MRADAAAAGVSEIIIPQTRSETTYSEYFTIEQGESSCLLSVLFYAADIYLRGLRDSRCHRPPCTRSAGARKWYITIVRISVYSSTQAHAWKAKRERERERKVTLMRRWKCSYL